MSMILANVLWMKKYEGDRHTLRNGASNLDEADHLIENSGEIYNFSKEKGFCRGYIALNAGGRWFPNIDLSKIDPSVSKDDEMIKGITVVWTAPHPGDGGRRVVVGVYKNATVFRKPRIAKGRPVPTPNYYFRAKAEDCLLVPHGERSFRIMTAQKARAEDMPGKWPGMSAIFYPNANPKLLADLSAYVDRISKADVQHPEVTDDGALPGRGATAINNLEDMEERLSQEVQSSLSGSEADLDAKLAMVSVKPERIAVTTFAYKRNADVIVKALKRSRGKCEACRQKGPFISEATQRPYLEVHHRTPLSAGGEDTVQNAVTLCPNCHRQEHHGSPRWPWPRRKKGTR